MKKTIPILFLFFTFSFSCFSQHGIFNIDVSAAEYVEVPDNANGSLGINNGFTVEAWILTGSAQSNQKVAGKIAGDFINGFILGIQDGQVNMEVFDNSNTQTVLQVGEVPDTIWTHIAGTYEVGGKLIIYINGKNVGETTASAGAHNANTNPFRIGIAPWDTNALGFFGYLDEVRYWNNILEESTLRDWMHKDLGSEHPNISDLALYHKYDEGADEIVGDLSGNNNNGILNGAWLPSTVPFKGVFDLYEEEVRGVWNGQTEANSDIMTLIGNNLEADQTIVFSHSSDPNEVIATSDPNTKRLSRVWRVTTQGMLSADLETKFDLSDVDLTDVNYGGGFSLMISEESDMSNASEIAVEFSDFDGSVLTIPTLQAYLDGLYYTLGFVGEGVSVEELFNAKEDIKINPNPGIGYFQISLENSIANALSLEIMDITGKILIQKNIETLQGTYIESFDLTGYPKGMYLLRLNDATKSSTRKIVIE